MITYKTAAEIEAMREAGKAVAAALAAMREAIVPDETTTAHLDDVAHETLKARGARPTLLGYQPSFSDVPYPRVSCISVNEEILHTVPSEKRILRTGDVVSLDLDASVDGWVADSAITVPVGEVSSSARNLIMVTREALYKAIAKARAGNTMGDVSSAMQRHVERARYNVIRSCTGHGIGRTPHEEPSVPCYGRPGTGIRLRPGMTFCIEPMVMIGKPTVVHRAGDTWAIIVADGSLSAHFEHTVAITAGGVEILTLPEEENRK
ncbi:MAG: type I methionyl aminopeptidase [Capsulimonadaceae bacterium]